MKTRLFIAAMAAIAIIGCQKEADGPVVADGQASFLKVDLRAAGTITKADDGGYVYGTDAENKVNTVHFWFFDASGAAYAVQGTQNFLAVTPSWAPGTPNQNVEEISDVVLVIKQSTVAPPTQMIAVLNAPAAIQKTMTKAELEAAVVESLKTGDGFIMSNSVYADGAVTVNATEILSENIFTSTEVGDYEVGDVIPADKVASMDITPIEVYVERVAAKVKVSGGTGVDLNKIPVYELDEEGEFTTNQVKDSKGNALFAKVLGWQITNDTQSANLLKKIDPSWDNTIGFTPWNNAAFFRSYWATTAAEPVHNFTFNDLKAHNVTEDYYFENTKKAADENGVDVDAEGSYDNPNTTANQASQLLVAAQLVDNAGAPVSLAKWYGVLYTVADLKTAMVGTVASKLYVKDGENLVSIDVDDVAFEQVPQTVADNRYEVKMAPKTGVSYFSADGSAADAATIIAGVDPAQMWGDETNKGYTYYYITVEHYGTAKGIVRNHCYDIKIDKVGGLGTPVYNPDMVITPEKPEDQDALNLAARVNILSWHLVNQNVVLQ